MVIMFLEPKLDQVARDSGMQLKNEIWTYGRKYSYTSQREAKDHVLQATTSITWRNNNKCSPVEFILCPFLKNLKYTVTQNFFLSE